MKSYFTLLILSLILVSVIVIQTSYSQEQSAPRQPVKFLAGATPVIVEPTSQSQAPQELPAPINPEPAIQSQSVEAITTDEPEEVEDSGPPHLRLKNVQTDFGFEDRSPKVIRPVRIPDAAFQAMFRDKKSREVFECFDSEEYGDSYDEPPHLPSRQLIQLARPALLASEIDLNRDGQRDLIVVTSEEFSCLWGGHGGPYWVLLKTPNGYKVVLTTYGLGFHVLKHKTNGMYNLKSSYFQGYNGYTNYFKFNGKKYIFDSED
ncbi:MAG: hypothetical protein HY774_09175 [Acidobacteria bacterium]|nr:hypothetical protein [Acidobacteriota bacterium]